MSSKDEKHPATTPLVPGASDLVPLGPVSSLFFLLSDDNSGLTTAIASHFIDLTNSDGSV